jgi:hypothetical protein
MTTIFKENNYPMAKVDWLAAIVFLHQVAYNWSLIKQGDVL